MSWRVAKSLDQLLAEINASAPNRSKASDGAIGDEAHQGTDSDHNPHCCGWVVTARDFTHDPAGGFDSYAYAEWQRKRCKGDILINGVREIRVKYIISNRRIASPTDNWAWRNYTGSNPHDKHAHVSVDCTGEGGYMDSTDPWGWSDSSVPIAPPVHGAEPDWPFPGDHYLGQTSPSNRCHSGYYASDRPTIQAWQSQMRARGWAIDIDGYYGDQSEAVCRAFQTEKYLGTDGLVGPSTWSAAWNAPVT
jgi:peptidoglycan hydrolase-like protein with peptidoglycan-binding domain